MVKNHARKNAAKAIGGKHTAALRHLSATEVPHGTPPNAAVELPQHPLPSWDDDRDPVLLITGTAGSGKTKTLQALVAACLLDAWESAVIEFGGYGNYAFASDWLLDLASDATGSVLILQRLCEELTIRQDLMREHRAVSIADLPADVRPPKILLAIDGEWPSAASADLMWRLTREGRAAGIRTAYAAQQLTTDAVRRLGLALDTTARLHVGPISYADAVAQFHDAAGAVSALANAPSWGTGAAELSGQRLTAVKLPHVGTDAYRAGLVQLQPRCKPVRVQMTASSMHPGDRVKLGFDGKAGAGRWWTARVGDSRFTILTRQADFRPKGEVFYTIVDWERGLRGPCDLLFPSWNMATDEGCAEMLAALNLQVRRDSLPADAAVLFPSGALATRVSHRNNVPVLVLAHEARIG